MAMNFNLITVLKLINEFTYSGWAKQPFIITELFHLSRYRSLYVALRVSLIVIIRSKSCLIIFDFFILLEDHNSGHQLILLKCHLNFIYLKTTYIRILTNYYHIRISEIIICVFFPLKGIYFYHFIIVDITTAYQTKYGNNRACLGFLDFLLNFHLLRTGFPCCTHLCWRLFTTIYYFITIIVSLFGQRHM